MTGQAEEVMGDLVPISEHPERTTTGVGSGRVEKVAAGFTGKGGVAEHLFQVVDEVRAAQGRDAGDLFGAPGLEVHVIRNEAFAAVGK